MSSHALRWLTKRSQRARVEAVGRWGASGVAAVMIGRLIASLRTAMATTVLLGAAGARRLCCGEEGGREKRNEGAGRCGRTLEC